MLVSSRLNWVIFIFRMKKGYIGIFDSSMYVTLLSRFEVILLLKKMHCLFLSDGAPKRRKKSSDFSQSKGGEEKTQKSKCILLLLHGCLIEGCWLSLNGGGKLAEHSRTKVTSPSTLLCMMRRRREAAAAPAAAAEGVPLRQHHHH